MISPSSNAASRASQPPLSAFLPTSKKELDARGWTDGVDVILFTGDAYVDHPSFGAAVIGRVLEAQGWRVAIVPQPNWRDDLRDFRKLGRPRLFFGISGGCMDSMVNHYTANRRLRSDDAYTAGGGGGQRPDRVVTVYSQILKNLYPDVPVVIGGIEASLRRLTHYDYWSDSLRPSVLIESGADLLVYGLGEKPICEIATRLAAGEHIAALTDIKQTAWLAHPPPPPPPPLKNHSPPLLRSVPDGQTQTCRKLPPHRNRVQPHARRHAHRTGWRTLRGCQSPPSPPHPGRDRRLI